MPIAWFSLFNMTVVMVLAPLFDAVVIPKLESCDFKFPVTWRMLSGLICCSISLLLGMCLLLQIKISFFLLSKFL